MAPLDWGLITKADPAKFSEEDAETYFEMLKEGDAEGEGDAGRLLKLFQVTQAVMISKQSQVEDVMSMMEEESKAAQKKEAELKAEQDKLKKEVTDLKKYGPDDKGGGTRDTRFLREELRELEQQNITLKQELKDMQMDLTQEKRAAEKYSERISELEKELKELRIEGDQLRQDNSDLKMQMQTHRENMVAKRGDESEFREKLTKKNKELGEVIEELQNLTDVNDDLIRQNQDLQARVDNATQEMNQVTEDYLKLKEVLQQTDAVTDRLREENEMLKAQVADLSDQVQSKSESDDAIMVAVNNKIDEWKGLMGEKDQQIMEMQQRLFQLKEELIAANMDSDKASVTALTKIIKEKDRQIEELTEQVNTYVGEMETNAAIIEDLRAELHRDSGKGGDRLQNKVRELQNEIRNLKETMREQDKDHRKMEDDASEKDKDLSEALERMRAYEQGVYGLSDAVAEIKDLKTQIKVRDRQIEELTSHINKNEMKINDILDENEELRYRLGMDPKEPMDLTEFRQNKNIRKEEEKALNFILQREIERLEDERLELKKKIRKLAQQTGQRAVALGLSAEDMIAVQDFQEELKVKRLEAKPESAAEVIKREVRLQETRIQGVELNEDYKKNLGELFEMERENAQLRSQMKQLHDDNKNLEDGMKEIMEVMKKAGQEAGKEGEPIRIPSLEKMIAAIEAKKVIGSYDTSMYLKEQVDVLRGRNEELRSALREARVEITKVSLERDKAFDKMSKMEKDQQVFQESGLAPGALAALPLPSAMAPTSAEVIASLNEHLVVTLQELTMKEEALRKADAALETYKRKFAVARHQQGLLYQDYLSDKKEWEQDVERLKEQISKLEGDIAEDKVKVQEFDRLVDTLSKDEVEVRRRLSDMTRRITVLRVNEKALTRRHTIMQEIEANLRKELHKLRNDMNHMETAISERMGYLQRYKDMSVFKVAALQKQLGEMVPSADLDKVNKEFHALTEKYRDVLQAENTVVHQAQALQGLEGEVKRLTIESDELRQTLGLEKERLHALEAAMEELHRKGVATGKEVAVTDGDIISISKKITMLEMKELNERQRAEHAVRMYDQQRAIIADLESRNQELEAKFAEITKMNLEMQKVERDLRDELANSVTKTVSDADRRKIGELEKTELTLKQEISKLKEVCEVASSQVKIFETQQVSREREATSLRQQLLDFQVQSDEKTIIGKLHRQIVALQVSEGTALRQLEEARKKVTKLESHVLRLEQRLDSKDSAIFHSRQEAASKARYLKRSLQDLRLQFAGAVPLSKQEKFAKNMLQLQQDKAKMEVELIKVRKERGEVEDKLAELQLQHASLQELMSTLKDGRGAAKVAEWHGKMDAIRLEEMKQKRHNNKLQQKIKYLEDVIKTHEASIASLEAELVQQTKEFEERQLTWEHREVELERNIQVMEKYTNEIAGAASKFEEAVGTLPDAKLPIANQLEQAISTIKSNVKVILDTQAESKAVKQKLVDLEKRLRESENLVLQRDRLIAELRLRMPATEDRDEVILKATVQATQSALQQKAATHDFESQQAFRIAQSTIASLKARIQQKEETLVKYQDLLSQAREEMVEMNRRHEQDLKSMQARIHASTDATFAKFRQAAEDLIQRQQAASRGPTARQLTRLSELEEQVGQQDATIAALSEKVRQKDEEIVHLRTRLQAVDRHFSSEKERLTEERSAQQGKHGAELDEYRRQVADYQKEVAVLNEEIHALKDANQTAPTVTMKNLVERLKNQLALKEKQHQALSKALTDLRADMVAQAQENIRVHSSETDQERNIQRIVDTHTAELKEQVDDLTGNLDRTRKELKKRKESEATLQSELEDVKEELNRKERSVNKLRSEKQRLEQEVDELEKKVERMNTMRTQKTTEHVERHLQHELEEARRHIKLLDEELKKRQTAEKPYEQKVEPAPPPPSSRAEETVRWEEKKKWQRTVEKMKNKIQDQDVEMDRLQKANQTLKNLLEKAQRDKEAVEARSRGMVTKVVAPTVSAPPRPVDHELEEARRSNYQLQEEVTRLRRQVNQSLDNSAREAQLRVKHLTEQVEHLERALARKAVEGGVSPEEYQRLFEKNQDLQRQVLQLSEKNLELQFENEQARKDTPRLRERISDLQKYIDALKMENAQLGGDHSARSSTSSIRRIGESGKTSRELEKTIAILTKVVDKLKAENAQLKKTSGTVTADQLQMLRRENEDLKRQLAELREAMGASLSDQQSQRDKGTVKLMADYEKIRKELIKEREASERLRLELHSVGMEREQRSRELADTRSRLEIEEAKRPVTGASEAQGWKSAVVTRMYEEKIKNLQEELDKKSKLLSEAKALVKDAAEREQRLLQERDELIRKNSLLEKYSTRPGPSGSGGDLARELHQAQMRVETLEEEKKSLFHELRVFRQQGGSPDELVEELRGKATQYDRAVAESVQLRMELNAVSLQRDSVQRENDKMRKDLSNFGPEFFEEIEDLKFNYKQAVERNVLYEEKLRQLSEQFGVHIDLPK